MHSFARHLHSAPDAAQSMKTKGLVMDQGWRYDLTVGFADAILFRGQRADMLRETIALAGIQPGEAVLDVGCGTGTLALAAQRCMGATGRVRGIDPGPQQLARARAKAARRKLPVDFQLGVIEQIPFPDQTFDVVLSTLMLHHLPAGLKRQGLAEIARVLKPDGRLVIADFMRKQERQGLATHIHAGGSRIEDVATLVQEAGFTQIETRQMRPARFSAFPGAGLLRAIKAR